MFFGHPLRRNEINVLFELRRHRFTTFFEWCEFPISDLFLDLRPEFQGTCFSACVRASHIAEGRDREANSKLIKARANSRQRDHASVRLNLVRARNLVVVRWWRRPIVLGRDRAAGHQQTHNPKVNDTGHGQPPHTLIHWNG